ncbi:MAG: DUF190 domain-containing protein [Stellaceae bacterium]
MVTATAGMMLTDRLGGFTPGTESLRRGVSMTSDITMVRIYLSEADRGPHKNLMQEIMNLLHDQHGIRGVTVFRGIAGLGDTGEAEAADLIRRLIDLPLVIEFFDEPQKIEAALPPLRDLVPAGQIVSWPAATR